MKPKKNQGADLGRRRTIFFEAGLAAAIAVVVTVFSVSQKERVVNTAWAIPDGDLFQEQIDRTVDKPEEKKVAQKVMVQAVDILKVVKNNHKILDPFTVMDPGAFEYFPVLEPMVEVIEDDVVDTAERMPKFLGGDLMTFRNWVFERLKYPQIAVDMGLEGKVVLQFGIE